MNEKISVFLPTRAGSERVKSKNTRPFNNIQGGLLKIKLEQLFNCSLVDEIVLSTNDLESINIAEKLNSNNKLVINQRPENLASSTTILTELVEYVPKICSGDHILWTHVTSPLVSSSHYDAAIEKYFEVLKQGYDSMMSVKEIQNFIWSKDLNTVINKKGAESGKWPRTQDLDKVFEVNSAIFIASKDIYIQQIDRIGQKPFLLTQNQVVSTDVDWEEDFKLAEVLFEQYGKY